MDRKAAKDSPEFHSLAGAIAAYGKALGLLVALQQRERILRNPVILERDPSQIGAQKSPRSLWRSLTSSFQFNANGLRSRSLCHLDVKDAVLQRRGRVGNIDLCRQVNYPQNLACAQLGINGVALLGFVLGFAFSADGQASRFDVNFKLLGAETRYLGPNGNMVIRLHEFKVHGVKQLGFSTQPIIQFTTGPSALAFKNLERSSGNCMVKLLHPVEDTRLCWSFDGLQRCGGLWGHLKFSFRVLFVWMTVQPVEGWGLVHC